MSEAAVAKHKILLVDDVPTNLDVLLKVLEPAGYRALVATNGERALQVAAEARPDLILLDIMMPPGIDGYEVCRRLKANPGTRDIPVIFLSALDDTEVKVRAFQTGGVDYVAKPFQAEEVCARVATHLRLRAVQQDLTYSNARLSEQLQQQERLLRDVSHELRSPLSRLQIATDLQEKRGQVQPYLAHMRKEINQIDGLLNEILTLLRTRGSNEQNQEEVDLAVLAETLGTQRCYQLEEHGLSLVPELRPAVALGDKQLIARAIGNLLDNAIKYTSSGGVVRIESGNDSTGCYVRVVDNGPGIPAMHLERVSEPFYRVEASRNRATGGVGLGLTIAHAVMQSVQGELRIESEAGQGTRAELYFPNRAGNGA